MISDAALKAYGLTGGRVFIVSDRGTWTDDIDQTGTTGGILIYTIVPIYDVRTIDKEDLNFDVFFNIKYQFDHIFLNSIYHEYRYRLLISLLVVTWAAGYWRRQPPSKSGFVGIVGKRKKGKA